jgi:hypothetical protein
MHRLAQAGGQLFYPVTAEALARAERHGDPVDRTWCLIPTGPSASGQRAIRFTSPWLIA